MIRGSPRTNPGKEQTTGIDSGSSDPLCDPCMAFAVMLSGGLLSSNSPLLAARDEFEFGRIQLHRRVSRVDVIPCSLLQGEFIHDYVVKKS
jgi:hypothetical protein